MLSSIRYLVLILVTAVLGCPLARAQAQPTATQQINVSAFGTATGVYTGFNSGRNLSITAGGDIGFEPIFRFYPSLELRGTIAVDKGGVASQKNVLAGVKFARFYRGFHPYADFLFGRGEINYPTGAVTPDHHFEYLQSTSNIFSPGIGADLQLPGRFAFKVDAQFQRYASPVADGGHLFAKSISAGIVYRFSFDKHSRR